MNISLTFDPAFDFFLQGRHQDHIFDYPLERKASVKDIIESLGVPHTEVGRIFFNGREIDFSFVPDAPGTMAVHAVSAPFDVLSPSTLRPDPLERRHFIADVNVLKLGRLMILLGFDVACSNRFSDQEIADRALAESRIVLTRDTNLLKRKKIVFARRIRSNAPYDQVSEVLCFFGLKNRTAFFSRCTLCNRPLVPVQKQAIVHLLEPKTKTYFSEFFQCPGCKKVFWKGSHYARMKQNLQRRRICSLP